MKHAILRRTIPAVLMLLALSLNPTLLRAQYADIHDFNYTTDGGEAAGIAAQGGDGNIYGTLMYGVNNQYGGRGL